MQGKKNFEKVTSFFDLIKSSNNADTNLAEQEQSGATTSDDEMSIHGITYQVSDDLSIGYHASSRDLGDKAFDEESKSLSVAYTQGGMTVKAQSVSMDNVGGSSSARDDIDGYKVSVSFAF